MIRRVCLPQQPARMYSNANQSNRPQMPKVNVPRSSREPHPELLKNIQKMKDELKKLNEDVKAGRVEFEVLDTSNFAEAMKDARRNMIPGSDNY